MQAFGSTGKETLSSRPPITEGELRESADLPTTNKADPTSTADSLATFVKANNFVRSYSSFLASAARARSDLVFFPGRC